MAGTDVVFSQKTVVQVSSATTSIHGVGTALYLIPVTSFTAEEVITPLPDNGRRGVHVLDFRQPAGVKLVNISLEGVVQADPGTALGFGVGVFLRNFFGGTDLATSVSAQNAGLWNHDFQLKSGDANPIVEYFTMEVDHQLGAGNAIYNGCRVQELVFAWNAGEGLLTYTATITAASVTLGASADLEAQAATIESGLPGWTALAAFDTAINYSTGPFSKLISAEWTLSRAVSVLYTAQNTQVANQIMLGPIACSVALTMDFDNTTEVKRFRESPNSTARILHVFKHSITSSALTNSESRRFIIGSDKFSIIDQPVTVDITGEHATIVIGARSLYSTAASLIVPDASVGANDGSMSANAGNIQIRLMDARVTSYK